MPRTQQKASDRFRDASATLTLSPKPCIFRFGAVVRTLAVLPWGPPLPRDAPCWIGFSPSSALAFKLDGFGCPATQRAKAGARERPTGRPARRIALARISSRVGARTSICAACGTRSCGCTSAPSSQRAARRALVKCVLAIQPLGAGPFAQRSSRRAGASSATVPPRPREAGVPVRNRGRAEIAIINHIIDISINNSYYRIY
jgi:hypothetical protein